MPARPPTVSSAEIDAGALAAEHNTVLTDVHAAVLHATPSMRLLGVALLCPKLSPLTVTTAANVRALLSTPR